MEEYQDVDVKFDDVVEFDRETVVLQKWAAKQDWETFKEKITKQLENNNAMKLLEPFDLFKNTVLHAVARGIIKKKAVARGIIKKKAVARSSGSNAKLLQELLKKLPEEQQREALTKENVEGNTLLHEAVMNKDNCLDTVDVIMEFGKQILNQPNGYYLQELLEHKNHLNETPVFRAAWRGNLKVLKHIHNNHQKLQADKHFPPGIIPADKKRLPILHSCLIRHKFGVAIWLVNEVGRNLITQQKSIAEHEEGFTCFQLLSKMPLAFRSQDTQKMKFRQFIYYMLPDEGYESELELDGAGNNSFSSKRDIESGQQPDDKDTPKSIFSKINYAIWKFSKEENFVIWQLLAKGFKCLGKIWEQKKKHKYAERLAKLLVKIEEDLWKYGLPTRDKMTLTLGRDFPSNVTEKKKEIELKKRVKKKVQLKQKILKQMNMQEPKSEEAEDIEVEEINTTTSSEISPQINDVKEKETKWETPLFLAAASGIKEVVEIILKNHPEFIYHVNKEGLNILHLAIKHRQLEIYEYIKGNKAVLIRPLKARISNNNGRTILHQAASMEYYREQALPGVAYQLQDELEWYHRVRSIVPQHYLMHCDNEGLTAGDLLDVEHAEMHDQAKQWMKETAQSCSTVAVLIAGVVFAAAYTIPGGTSKNGKAELLNAPAFQFFTIMDVMALACSLGSVVMFLSILTSSFDLWDFHKSLPRKLKLGFIMLFCALIATILAFAATILLTVHMEGNKKTTTIIYSLAFMVVSVFGLTQFPLYKMIEDMVKQCTQCWKMARKQA